MKSNQQHKNTSEYQTPPLLDYAYHILDSKANALLKTINKRIIRKIQKFGIETVSAGDDSGLENLWDDFCVQVQYEEGDMFDMQEDIVLGIISDCIDDLKEKDHADYDILNLYMSNIDIRFMWDDKDLYFYCDDELANSLLVEIKAIAMNYYNNKIRRYLDML